MIEGPVWIGLLAVACVTGCGGGCAASAAGEPPKIAAMKGVIERLSQAHALSQADQSDFTVTIAPTVSNGSEIQWAWRTGYSYRLEWSRDTVTRTDVATLVETLWRQGRIIRTDVTVYYWDRGRWVTGDDLARSRYPREVASLEELARRMFRTPTSKPAIR